MVHVGAIDADYTGQICAMVSTATPPVTIEKGTRLAQLVPFQSCVPQTDNVIRGNGGFGSTGKPQVYWVQTVSDQRPQMHGVLELSGATPKKVRLAGLLDTGADVTIISLREWPAAWPLTSNALGVAGLGGVANSYMSTNPTVIVHSEGQRATVRPHVTSTPLNLWGRDCLGQWGVRITTDF